jgi:hypothetical protein
MNAKTDDTDDNEKAIMPSKWPFIDTNNMGKQGLT